MTARPPLPRACGGCGFGEGTFAGVSGNDEGAPISDLPAPARNPERGDSTLSGKVTAKSAAVFQSVNQLRQLAEAKTAWLTS